MLNYLFEQMGSFFMSCARRACPGMGLDRDGHPGSSAQCFVDSRLRGNDGKGNKLNFFTIETFKPFVIPEKSGIQFQHFAIN